MKRYFAILSVCFMFSGIVPAVAQTVQSENFTYFEYGWGWDKFAPPSVTSTDYLLSYPKSIFFPELTLMNERGEKAYLSDYKNSFVLVNLWATWCAPCVAELPGLNKLQKEMGSNMFHVVTVSMEQDKELEVRDFMNKHGIDTLDAWVDKKGSSAQIEGVGGLPVTFFLDPFRKELFRITGPVDWDSPDIRNLINYYMKLWQDKTPERVKICEKKKLKNIDPYTGKCL